MLRVQLKVKKDGEKNMDYVVKVFTGSGSFCNQSNEFETPDSFQSIFSNKKAMNWLSKNNCWRHGLGIEQKLNMMLNKIE